MRQRELLLRIGLHLVLILAAAITLAPMLYLVAATFKSSQDMNRYVFFPPPNRLSTENIEKIFGAARFFEGDVKDWAELKKALTTARDSTQPLAARRIWERLTPEAQRSTERLSADTENGRNQVVTALNALLSQRDLYDREAFAKVNLSSLVLNLLDRRETMEPTDLEALNRQLVNSVFPTALSNIQIQIPFVQYLMNSFFVSSVTVLIQLFFCSLAGFALAKYEFRFKKLVMVVMLGTMMIPGQVMLGPMYELIHRFGLMDSHQGLIVPSMVSVFGIFLFRQSILSLPNELLEAGRIDGCTEFGLYWRVVVPVSRPMIGAFCVIAFMGTWNSFLWPQIILHSQDLFTLPIGLNSMVGTYTDQRGMMMAGTLLSILPVMVLFFILQKEFISGLTAGAVKG
jgi:ABC-type glycerol-3-phosphate transport system permease component